MARSIESSLKGMEFVGHPVKPRRPRSPVVGLRDALGDYRLPAIPRIPRQLLKMLQDPHVTFARAIRTLERDPVLAGRVMEIFSAAGFAARRSVENVDFAVSLLGLRAIEPLVVAAMVPTLINEKSTAPAPFMDEFWATSARRAMCARFVAEDADPGEVVFCFSVGLLQDMALPLLVTHRRREYEHLLSGAADGPGVDSATHERAAVEFDHAQVSGWIAAKLGLPYGFRRAVETHHEDDDEVPFAIRASAMVPFGVPLPECAALRAALESSSGEDAGARLDEAEAAASALRPSLMRPAWDRRASSAGGVRRAQ